MDNDLGLKKQERLCSKKAIDALFSSTDSSSLSAYPIRAVFRFTEEAENRILVSVSKKRFKHAVDRNRVKRQLREAYRLNKSILSSAPDKGLDIAFIWLTNKHHKSEMVVSKMISILKRIEQSRTKIDETTTQDTQLDINSAHTFLSNMHLTPHASSMQIYSNVQPIRHRGTSQAWPFQRNVSCNTQNIALSPMGRTWL